jgi:hypothetical protein
MRSEEEIHATVSLFPGLKFIVPMRRDGTGYVPGAAVSLPAIDALTDWAYYPKVDQVLAYGSPGIFSWRGLYKLEGTEPAAIGGGHNAMSGQIYLHGVASRHEVIVTGETSIAVYDGQHPLRDVSGWSEEAIGPTVWVYDLPALDKVLIAGAHGLFELTRDDRLVELPLPPGTGTHVGNVTEMPASHIAVIFTENTVLALDRAGNLTLIVGAGRVEPKFLGFNTVVRIPVREEVFVDAQNGHFLVRDEAITGAGSCDAATHGAPH